MFNIMFEFNSSLGRKIFKSTSIYAIGNIINKAVPFILLPILTRFLSPEEYGILATFTALFGIVQIVIYMGTTDAIVRGFFDREKQNFVFSEYVFNGILINVLVFGIILSGWFILKNWLSRLIPIPFKFQLFIPIISFFVAVMGIPLKLWVIRKKPVSHVIFNMSNAVVELILAVLFVAVLRLGWQGRIGSLFFAKFLFFLIGMYFVVKYGFFKIRLNKSYLKDIFAYGFPVVLHSLGFVIIAAIDKFFINAFVGLSATGVYSVSFSVCSLIAFFTGAFNLAWMPFFYENLHNPTDFFKKKLVKCTYLYFALVLVGVFLFILTVPYVLRALVGEKFLNANIFIFWLSLGFGFHAMYTVVVNYIFYAKKTYILSKIAMLTIFLSVAFNYVLIRVNGALGVAQATCLVFFFRFILVWYFSNRVYPMPWFKWNIIQ
ncbi:MAG: oligosaccharide flippase family protein [Candidatus Omnitrophota bacterium]